MSQLQIGDVTNSSAIIRDKVRLCIQRGMITRSECEVVVISTVEEVGPVGDIGTVRKSCKHVLQCTCPPFEDHVSARSKLHEKVGKCLRSVSVKNCTSICFPPLGTGVGYSPTSVAKWMIEAIDSYCDCFPRSSLSHVSIVIYEKDKNTHEGFDNAMYSLMASSVKLKSVTNLTNSSMIIGGEVKLAICNGDITDCQEEVIVSSTTRDVDLSRGNVAQALAKKAGDGLRRACKALVPLESCEVKSTGGFNLKCKKIFHCNCPAFESETVTKSKLQDVVKKCLFTAATNKLGTISFPALGAGNLKYPLELVAKWMVEQAIEHCEMFPRSSITSIKIVLFDEATRMGFDKFMKSQRYREESDTHLLVYNRLHFDLVIADISDSIEDDIVVSTWSGTGCSSPLTKALHQRAGPDFQQACSNLRPLAAGSVVKTSSFGMPCKQLLHTDCENWTVRGSTHNLKKTVTSCLTMAAQSNHRSIAFPAVGLGAKGYPPNKVCEGIIESVTEYCEKNVDSSIMTVKLYLHPTTEVDVVEEFRWSIRMLGCTRQKYGFLLANDTKFTFAKGDLAETKAGIIVNSTGGHMSLSGGKVSVQLMNKAGEALQDECTRLGPIVTGQIVMTEGFGLPCEHVLHVCCPSWETGQSERALRELIIKCLTWANDYRVSSIAFPAVGTGMLRYPPGSVARCLVHAAADFTRMNKHTTVKHIMLVVYSNDLSTVEGIEKAMDMELPQQENQSETGTKPKTNFKVIFDLPANWQPPTHSYQEFVVDSETREYKDLSADFHKTVNRPGYSILEVSRIQNPVQYQLYDVKKQAVARVIGKSRTVETAPLWHGTTQESVQWITGGNFDRGFAKQNSRLGVASYFSTSAHYSSQDMFSPANENGIRYMISARVITGDYCKGKRGIRNAPYKDPSSPISDQYDSVVDDEESPTMYAVFHDASAYPEYVIKYKY